MGAHGRVERRPGTPRSAAPALHVCLLTESYRPEIGGGETQAEVLAQGLVSRGFRVTVLTRRTRTYLPLVEIRRGVEIRRLPPAGKVRLCRWRLMVSAALELLHACPYDILFVSGFRTLGLPAALVARGRDRACVLKADSLGEMSGEYFRDGLGRLGRSPLWPAIHAALSARSRAFRLAGGFVAISSPVREELRAAGMPPGAVRTIPNGVDTARFRPARPAEKESLRRSFRIADATPVVVFTGRLVSYKGLPLLLQVWRDLLADHPRAELHLVGEAGLDRNACADHLHAFVREHGLERSVRFIGAARRVEDRLKAADVFVLPSENEAFGVSLAEAMACGLPCIATRCGGLVDLIETDLTGLLVEPCHPGELRAALDRLLRDSALRERLGGAAARSARARFAVDVIVEQYAELFRSLV